MVEGKAVDGAEFGEDAHARHSSCEQTSLEIAELTGKPHNDVLKAIRKMEPAWEKTTGRKFALCEKYYQMANGVQKAQPYYSLTKTECLYM